MLHPNRKEPHNKTQGAKKKLDRKLVNGGPNKNLRPTFFSTQLSPCGDPFVQVTRRPLAISADSLVFLTWGQTRPLRATPNPPPLGLRILELNWVEIKDEVPRETEDAMIIHNPKVSKVLFVLSTQKTAPWPTFLPGVLPTPRKP